MFNIPTQTEYFFIIQACTQSTLSFLKYWNMENNRPIGTASAYFSDKISLALFYIRSFIYFIYILYILLNIKWDHYPGQLYKWCFTMYNSKRVKEVFSRLLLCKLFPAVPSMYIRTANNAHLVTAGSSLQSWPMNLETFWRANVHVHPVFDVIAPFLYRE